MKEVYVKPTVIAKDTVTGLFPVLSAFVAGVAMGKAVGHALDGNGRVMRKMNELNVKQVQLLNNAIIEG